MNPYTDPAGVGSSVGDYIFGGSTGLTADQVKRRRDIAAAVAAQNAGAKYPETTGQGLTALGRSVGGRFQEERLRAAELELAKTNAGMRNGAPLATYGGAQTTSGAQAVRTPSYSPTPVTQSTTTQGNTVTDATGGRAPDDYSYMLPQNPAFQSAPDINVQNAIKQFEPDETMRGFLNQLSAREQPVPGQASPTGADGPFQFTKGTGAQYGLYGGAGGDLRSNANAATQGAIQFTRDNVNAFMRSNGRPPTLPEVALMHQQGAPGGMGLINGRVMNPGNLSVNNVNPNAGAASAVQRIKQYYGMPDQPVPQGYGATPRDKIAAALNQQEYGQPDNTSAPQEVAQQNANPTEPGEDTPPVTGGSVDQPTRLAALDTGTVSDAPPVGSEPPALQVSNAEPQDENPPTPSDIKPAPQVAQLGGGGTTMMPPGSYDAAAGAPAAPGAAPPGAPPGAAPGAPGAPALANPLAPLKLPPPQTMADPGPRPDPPKQLPQSQSQLYWLRIGQNPFADDTTKNYAQQQYGIEEKYRQDLQTRREADYVNDRERWEQKKNEYDKFQRETEDRNFKQRVEYIAANNSQADLEKKLYEQGTPREQAAIKAALDIKNAQLQAQKGALELTEPKEHVIDQQILQRGLGERNYTVAPGSPSNTKLTETQAKTVKFLQRAAVASSVVGNADALRGLKDTVAGKVPIAGNFALSPEYQSQYSAGITWAMAVLRDESGANITPKEAIQKFDQYFPKPGDSPALVAQKAARRQAEEQSLYNSLGDQKKQMDEWYTNRKSLKVGINPATGKPFQEGDVQRSPSTGKTRSVIGGHWVYPDEY